MNVLDLVVSFATKKHEGQYRKGTTIPYIFHPLEVMQILRENGANLNCVVAGVLHDTLEDTSATIDEITTLFGTEVSDIINVESEDKSLPYRERKFEHMQRVKNSSTNAKMVNCADKLSNIKSMYIDHLTLGEKLWERFNGTKEDIAWYYSVAIDALEELKDIDMYQKVKYYYQKLFGKN